MKNAIFRDFFEFKVSRKIWIFVVISIILHFIAFYILSTLPFEAKPLPRRVRDDTRANSQVQPPLRADGNERRPSTSSGENREPEEEIYEGAEGPERLAQNEDNRRVNESDSNREPETVSDTARGEGSEGAVPAAFGNSEADERPGPSIPTETVEAGARQDTGQREIPPHAVAGEATAAVPYTYKTTRDPRKYRSRRYA